MHFIFVKFFLASVQSSWIHSTSRRTITSSLSLNKTGFAFSAIQHVGLHHGNEIYYHSADKHKYIQEYHPTVRSILR